MTPKQRHGLEIGAGVAGGVALLAFILRSAPSSAPTPNAKPAMMPNPANAQLESQYLAAREAALGGYDQSIVAERGIGAQQQTADYAATISKEIAFNQSAEQLRATSLATAAAEAIAKEQAQTQLQEVQAAQQVQDQQSNQGFWGSILSGIFGFLPSLFGAGTVAGGGGTAGGAAMAPFEVA